MLLLSKINIESAKGSNELKWSDAIYDACIERTKDMYKAKKEAIIYVNWCRPWQQTNQNRSWRALCVWTAAESDPAVRPEPAILWYLLHTVQ